MRLYRAEGLHIQKSEIHGYGVFTDTHINKGDIVEVLPIIQKVTHNDKEYCGSIFTHSAFPYLDGKHFWHASGYMGMLNHSSTPNLDWSIDYDADIATFVAIKDIDKDQEININYERAGK